MRLWQPNRRPIVDEEKPYLKALGAAVRELRQKSGLTAKELSVGAMISEPQFWKICAGSRRTKRSTLGRLVSIAVEANPGLAPAEQLLERLCRLAGPTVVLDAADLVSPHPPTVEEVRALYAAWCRQQRAAERARRRFDAADSRYYRLNGEHAYVG